MYLDTSNRTVFGFFEHVIALNVAFFAWVFHHLARRGSALTEGGDSMSSLSLNFPVASCPSSFRLFGAATPSLPLGALAGGSTVSAGSGGGHSVMYSCSMEDEYGTGRQVFKLPANAARDATNQDSLNIRGKLKTSLLLELTAAIP